MATGYGRETWCLDSVSTTRFAFGITILAQACYRRLTTSRGTLRGSDEAFAYGYDLSELVGAVGTADAVVIAPSMARAELMKDDRVRDVTATATAVTAADGTTSIELTLRVYPIDSTESFPLTLSVTDASVALLGGLPT